MTFPGNVVTMEECFCSFMNAIKFNLLPKCKILFNHLFLWLFLAFILKSFCSVFFFCACLIAHSWTPQHPCTFNSITLVYHGTIPTDDRSMARWGILKCTGYHKYESVYWGTRDTEVVYRGNCGRYIESVFLHPSAPCLRWPQCPSVWSLECRRNSSAGKN